MVNQKTKDSSLNQKLQKTKKQSCHHTMVGCTIKKDMSTNKKGILQNHKQQCPRKQSTLVISQHLHVDPFIKCEHNGIVDGQQKPICTKSIYDRRGWTSWRNHKVQKKEYVSRNTYARSLGTLLTCLSHMVEIDMHSKFVILDVEIFNPQSIYPHTRMKFPALHYRQQDCKQPSSPQHMVQSVFSISFPFDSWSDLIFLGCGQTPSSLWAIGIVIVSLVDLSLATLLLALINHLLVLLTQQWCWR